jgi:uncharacterized membrane protein/ribosomal protein S18 acetylase RimI-like enzyme
MIAHPGWTHRLFSNEDLDAIAAAVARAEAGTSGEIRVHLERRLPRGLRRRAIEPLVRARQVFSNLGMDRTRERNAVLIYLAIEDRKLAIVGDHGIHSRVQPGFWERLRDGMVERLGHEAPREALVQAVIAVGETLRRHYPPVDAVNELPDRVSLGPAGAVPAAEDGEAAPRSPGPAAAIRAYDPATDAAGLRQCFVELQDFERALEPGLPAGEAVADRYLAEMLLRCERSDGRVFVAEGHAEIEGFVCILARMHPEGLDEPPDAYAYVSDLVVRRRSRGAGLGRALLARAEAHARASGVGRLRIAVLARNAAARRLYERLGFREYTVQLLKDLGPSPATTSSDPV